ncbi:MAG: Fic family protein [Rhizobiales bacterium]|nr:Fic family protein [Hyphomicrobiales bacterium]
MMWNWQQKEWPNFSYDKQALEGLEEQFLKNAGEHLGALKHISNDDQDLLKVELLSEEALKTSEIEGEFLDRDSLQSSICHQFGLKTDNRKVPPAEQGIAAMMVGLYKTFDTSLSHEYLWQWHEMLINGQQNIVIGKYRDSEEPMRVVSGVIYDPTIHFEAPPANILQNEMKSFIAWFNASSKQGKSPLPALTRAAIAHLYFVCIHPFEDGNGRISRAIAEKSLAQSLNQPTLISLAYTIERDKKSYYSALESNNKEIDITNWIIYFAKTVLTAQDNTRKRIEFIIEKTKLYYKLDGSLNSRQEKVIERMFREGFDGFKGGLSAENYNNISPAPRTTVTRDLNDLVNKGALIKIGQLKHTRYYLNIVGQVPNI